MGRKKKSKKGEEPKTLGLWRGMLDDLKRKVDELRGTVEDYQKSISSGPAEYGASIESAAKALKAASDKLEDARIALYAASGVASEKGGISLQANLEDPDFNIVEG